MSREYTLFQFDVDEGTVRRVLSSVPGVTPLGADESDTPEADESAQSREEREIQDSESGSATVREYSGTDAPGVTHGRPTASAGAESHLSGSTRNGDDQSRIPVGRTLSTPWPGAPVDLGEGKQSLMDRLAERKKLIVAGLGLGLGAVGAAGVWLWKRRSNDDPAGDGPGALAAPTPTAAESQRTASAPSRSGTDPDTNESGSSDYPMDVAPVVGMAFLAVAAFVLRRFRSGEET